MNDIGHERKCAVCKRKFIIYPDWVYKRGEHDSLRVFCSWKCLRAYDAGMGTAKERRERIIKALKDGLSVKEVAILLDEDFGKVYYWREKLRKEQENERETGAEEGSKAD